MRKRDLLSAFLVVTLSLTSLSIIYLDATKPAGDVQGSFAEPRSQTTTDNFVIQPGEVTLRHSDWIEFKSLYDNGDGTFTVIDDAMIVWSLTNTTIGTINPNGVFYASAMYGSHPDAIKATRVDDASKTAYADVTILNDSQIVNFWVEPATIEVPRGGNVHLYPKALTSASTVIPINPNTVTWTVLSDIGSIQLPNDQYAVLNALGIPGDYFDAVTAAYYTFTYSNNVRIINPVTVANLYFDPPNYSVEVGESLPLTVYYDDQNSVRHTAPHDQVTWSTSSTSAVVNTIGVFYSPTTGTHTVTAYYSGKTTSAIIQVVNTSSGGGGTAPTYTPTPTSASSNLSPTNTPTPPITMPTRTPTPTITPITTTGVYVTSTPTPQLYPWETPRPSRTPTPQPSTMLEPTPTPKRILVTNYNVLNVKECLVNLLGEQTFTEYFASGDKNKPLSDLGDRRVQINKCIDENKIEQSDTTLQNCLINQLGQNRFDEIAAGNSRATEQERIRVNICYQTPKIVEYSSSDSPTDDITDACLRLKIGDSRLKAIRQGQIQPTPEEVELGRQCYSVEQPVARPPMIIQAPQEVRACIVDLLGESYDSVTSRITEPTEEERKTVQECFGLINRDQRSFVPAVPEYLPFIEKSQEDITVTSIEPNVYVSKVTYSIRGTSSVPNALIDIYLFSDPIVFSARTDANGDWFYELNYHLEAGEHEAYSVVQHPEKGLVKSEVSVFTVVSAQTVEAAGETPELVIVQEPTRNNIRNYLIVSAIAVVCGVALLVVYAQFKTAKVLKQND